MQASERTRNSNHPVINLSHFCNPHPSELTNSTVLLNALFARDCSQADRAQRAHSLIAAKPKLMCVGQNVSSEHSSTLVLPLVRTLNARC